MSAKQLRDIAVRYQVYLERLKAGEIRRLPSILQQLDKAITSVLNSVDTESVTPRELDAFLADMRAKMGVVLDRDANSFMQNLRQISDYSTGFEKRTIDLILPASAPTFGTVPQAVAWANATRNPIQATGTLLEQFVKSWGAQAKARVEKAVRIGVAQGQTTSQIVRTIRGTKALRFKDGIIVGQTQRAAEAVVRTSVQHVASQARQSLYDANDDLLDGYMWISTLDSRTTSQCRSLDHMTFEIGKGPMPPIHVNCRSTTIPMIKGIDVLSLTTRASNGDKGGAQVSAQLSYYEWLGTQPAAFQDDALGPVRGLLFRNGGLSAEKFAKLNLDKNFEPLTLAQMRAKEPSVFERAGL